MMDQTVQEIRSEIEESKRKIGQTAQKVEERFEEMTDWKSMVQRYPLASFGVSVVLGVILVSNSAATRHVAGRTGEMLKNGLWSMLLPRIFPEQHWPPSV